MKVFFNTICVLVVMTIISLSACAPAPTPAPAVHPDRRTDRPLWENQITDPDDLLPGQFAVMYWWGNGWDEKKQPILLLTTAKFIEGRCAFEYVDWKNNQPARGFSSLLDCEHWSLIPYGDRLWQGYDRLLKSDIPALSPEELQEVKSWLELRF